MLMPIQTLDVSWVFAFCFLLSAFCFLPFAFCFLLLLDFGPFCCFLQGCILWALWTQRECPTSSSSVRVQPEEVGFFKQIPESIFYLIIYTSRGKPTSSLHHNIRSTLFASASSPSFDISRNFTSHRDASTMSQINRVGYAIG